MLLPNGWKRLPLHEIAEVRTGLAKGKANLKDPVELPYLRVANVQDGHINLKEVKTIRVERSQVERYSLRLGDILMTEGGDFDKLGRGDVWQGQIPVCLHQNHVFAVRPNPSQLNSAFLAALAASEYGRSYFLSCAKRSTNLASINASQLKKFPVLTPPLSEQRKISEILGAWDSAISTTQRLLANSRKQKQLLVENLVSGKQRFGSGQWSSASLKQIASIVVSSVNKKHEEGERKVRLCNYTDVYYNEHITADIDFMHATASEHEIAKFYLRRGDVLLTKDSETPNDIAISACVSETIPDLVCGYHLAVIRPDASRIDSEFLHNFFSLRLVRAYFTSRANGATRFGLPMGALENARIHFPSLDEQRRIAQTLLANTSEIVRLNRVVKTLKAEKAALMRQLLTGGRRVHLPQQEEVEFA